MELNPGDFFPTLTQDSKFRLLANGEPSSKCRWLDQDALGEVTAELTQLELAYWRDISELLAIETSQPQTAVSVHEPGELLIREGDQSTCIFEMIGGEAEVVVGGNIVGQIHSGEFFGEFTFLVEAPRSATVRATTHCTVQEISADEFERLIKSRPQIILDIAKDLAKRLQSTNQKVDNPKPAPRAKPQPAAGVTDYASAPKIRSPKAIISTISSMPSCGTACQRLSKAEVLFKWLPPTLTSPKAMDSSCSNYLRTDGRTVPPRHLCTPLNIG